MRYPLRVPGLEERRVEVETAGAMRGARVLLDGVPVPAGAKKSEFLVPRPDGSSVLVQLRSMILDPVPKVIVYGGPPPPESASSWPPRPNVPDATGTGVPQTLAEPFAWYEWVLVGLPMTLIFAGGAIGGALGGVAATLNGVILRSALPRAARLAAAFGVSALAFALFIPAALWARSHLFHHDAPAPLYGSGGPAGGPAFPGGRPSGGPGGPPNFPPPNFPSPPPMPGPPPGFPAGPGHP